MFAGYSTAVRRKQTKERKRKSACYRAHRWPSNYKYFRHNLPARTESQIPTHISDVRGQTYLYEYRLFMKSKGHLLQEL
jgi:hypothetical protein